MIDELLKFKERAERIDEEFKKFHSDIHSIAVTLTEELNRVNQKDYRIEVIGSEDNYFAEFCGFSFYLEKDGKRQYVTNFSLDDFDSSTIDGILESLDLAYDLFKDES